MSNNIFPINYRPLNVKTFLYDYLAEKIMKHTSKERIEIELRKGCLKAQNSQSGIPPIVYKLSNQNPIIVSTDIKSDIPFLKTALALTESVSCRFDPNLKEKEFYELLDFFDKYLKKDDHSCEFSVDFKLNLTPSFKQKLEQNGHAGRNGAQTDSIKSNFERLTWNLSENSFYDNSKLCKENIDIIHQNTTYRISTAFERKEDLAFLRFIEKTQEAGVSFMRVKSRHNYVYQFMTYSFTMSWNINDSSFCSKIIQKLIQSYQSESTLSKEQWIQSLLGLISEGKLRPSFEIESEINDIEYLRNFIVNQNLFQFQACIDRFVRNFELLYKYSVLPKQQDYHEFLSQHFKEPEIQYPLLGAYLDLLASKEKLNK